jgi:hypothetical protein
MQLCAMGCSSSVWGCNWRIPRRKQAFSEDSRPNWGSKGRWFESSPPSVRPHATFHSPSATPIFCSVKSGSPRLIKPLPQRGLRLFFFWPEWPEKRRCSRQKRGQPSRLSRIRAQPWPPGMWVQSCNPLDHGLPIRRLFRPPPPVRPSRCQNIIHCPRQSAGKWRRGELQWQVA